MLRPSRILQYARGITQQELDKVNWTSTLQLPTTTFPARAPPEDLATYRQRCTDQLYKWQKEERSATVDSDDLESADNKFVLHDGPPYANGAVHVGHAVNKITKDLILRTNLVRGKQVHYRPGWDCHGLPIELKALREAAGDGKGKTAQDELAGGEVGTAHDTPVADALRVRKQARALAARTVEEQSASFRSWGIMGDWDEPYLTMDKDFEIRQLSVFKVMVEKGLIYRQNKPVHWSPSSRTALAEAELEYNDNHKVTAAYIKFPITSLPLVLLENNKVDPTRLTALIWTTTPWTLPANTAIGVRSDIVYTLIDAKEEGQMLVAKDRLESLNSLLSVQPEIIIAEIPGKKLLETPTEYVNVLSGKTSRIIGADFVTSTSGTGLVHMAAGHGMDDYLALKREGFEGAFAPVDDAGKFTADAYPSDPSRLQGLYVESHGSRAVLEILRDRSLQSVPARTQEGISLVLTAEDYAHRHPIDWRTKKSVITRATNQWFADVSRVRKSATQALQDVGFHPETGKNRLTSFLAGRQEWCISRQRSWGVPIPALYNASTGEAVMTPESIEHIIGVIRERGTDAWWSDPVNDPAWIAPSLINADYVRGKDTMDVWFDSGTSWTGLEPRHDVPLADAYVEGSDQHRGWFQSSVLTYVATQEVPPDSEAAPPFRQLITHGFTLDQHGHKMSKSLGNVVTPEEILNGNIKIHSATKSQRQAGKDQVAPSNRNGSLGPDALRLWVASSDYTKDITISQPSVLAVHQALNKYRITFKWLLGVLSDYPEDTISTELLENDMPFADQAILRRLSAVSAMVHEAQDEYDFSRQVELTNQFINKDLSAGYFEQIKDRLYAGGPEQRQHTQTILLIIMQQLMTWLGPVTPLLVEEAWAHLPEPFRAANTHPLRAITAAPFSTGASDEGPDEAAEAQFAAANRIVSSVWAAAKAAQEQARRAGKIGSGLQCALEIALPTGTEEDGVNPFALELLASLDDGCQLEELLVASHVDIVPRDPALRAELDAELEGDPEAGDVAREWIERRREAKDWVFEAEFDCDVGGEGQGAGEGAQKGLVRVVPALGEKCLRCWKYTVFKPAVEEMDEQAERLSVCDRCVDVLGLEEENEDIQEDEGYEEGEDEEEGGSYGEGEEREDGEGFMDLPDKVEYPERKGRAAREDKKRTWRDTFSGRR